MAVKLLDAVDSTGAGPSWRVQMGVREHTVAMVSTGSPTVVTVLLEGSLDGITWYVLAEHNWISAELSASKAMFHVTSKLVTYVRLNLDTLTAGTSPTITGKYEGEHS